MKNLPVILLSLLMIVSCGSKRDTKATEVKPYAAKVSAIWISNLEDAIKTAAEENKTVLVDFTGSDWCGWCVRLKDEVFSKPEFIEYSKNSLVLVELDFPQSIRQSEETKKYNRKLLDKYGVQGFPTILIINKEGNEIGRTGYQQGGAAAYVEHLKGFIE